MHMRVGILLRLAILRAVFLMLRKPPAFLILYSRSVGVVLLRMLLRGHCGEGPPQPR